MITYCNCYTTDFTPSSHDRDRQEIEQYHRLLIERLDKPERKMVLRIIDAGDRIANELSLDSFICGFLLAWEMTSELNHYQDKRPASEKSPGQGASVYPDKNEL